MKSLTIILLLSLATFGSSDLLEMSKELWTRVLGGGFAKVGKLDPLYVPVIKVDQSEGNTSYRIVLRNLEVSGLNNSKVESVHIVRGRLRSNLSDNEAGYVNYNEQRGIDSIRYRFHTLVKEPKPRSSDIDASASNQFARIIEFDPMRLKIQEEDELFLNGGQASSSAQQQGVNANVDATRENRKNNEQVRQGFSQSATGGMEVMGVAAKPTLGNPSSVRLVYTNNYQQNSGNSNAQVQDANVRPCIGACRPSGRVETRRLPSQQGPFPPVENARAQYTENYQYQRYSTVQPSVAPQPTPPAYAMNAQFGQSGASFGVSGGQQRQSQFSVRTSSNSGINYSGNYRNGQIQVSSNGEPVQGPQGTSQGGLYVNQGGFPTRIPYEESQQGSYAATAQFGGASFSAGNGNVGVKDGNNAGFNYNGNYRRDRISAEVQRGNVKYTPNPNDEGSEQVYFQGSAGELCNPEEELKQARFQAAQRNGFGDEPASSNIQEFESLRTQPRRVEQQPGYVDVVYAADRQRSESRSQNLRTAPGQDPRVYGLQELVKDLRGNQRYIVHNFTEGESLKKRNDAVRVAAESKRIKDLIRYAKEYQEQQGYYEEGMELVYHFGNANVTDRSNVTLTRRKRQHVNDKDEDDVMHVIVRIRVPMLSVKSNYALMGKVDRQLLRGNGRLAGNFTDLIADFTVELKKVDNSTMIVRAARAKLISKNRNIKLDGMDEKGPVDTILTHGLMAAEAVAAMIADDLATKGLNEGNAEGVIFKMYKNLPVIQRS